MLAWRKSLGKYGLVKSDCEIPMIKDDEVLVRVLATGICGTDFGIYKGYREVEEGLIPGHEFIGEIVKLGSSVTGYEVGDRVVPSMGVRTESWTTMGSERSREICFHRKKSTQP